MHASRRWLVLAVVVAAAAYVVLLRLGEHDLAWRLRQWGLMADITGVDHPSLRRDGRFVAHDVYAAYYPAIVYLLRAVQDGGRGLLWNPFQNCGQPFLAMIAYGLLSPIQLVTLVFGADQALWLMPLVHLVVGGLSAYLLCRELGAGRTAALVGALAFELGNGALETAVWLPAINGSYVLLPAALLFCERALRCPGPRNAIGLAVVMALVWLAGFPQLAVYTCELLALRVAWEVASGKARWSAVVAVALGILAAPLVAGIQMVPTFEVVRDSSRHASLTPQEMTIGTAMSWEELRLALGGRLAVHQPFTLVPCMLAGAALASHRTRARAAFYAVAGLVFLVLAMGPSTPVFGWYVKLPFAALFREPARFTWLTSVSLAVLAGLGAHALLADDGAPARWGDVSTVATMIGVLVGFHLLASGGLGRGEWALAGVGLTAAVVARWIPSRRGLAAAGLCGAVLLNFVATPAMTMQFLLSTPAALRQHADVFARLRGRMTAQDRVYFSFPHPFVTQFALIPKSGMLFGIPTLVDYEPSASRRYAEYFMMMKTGAPMQGPTSFIANQGGGTPRGFNARLLDLAAGRYIVAEASVDTTTRAVADAPRLVEDDGDVRVYENPRALPRARWVPRIEVVDDASALLSRLASGSDDPHELALVEVPPASGFRGLPGNNSPGKAEFVSNEPEHVVVRVDAPSAGFLVLADQFYPGWTATVNGSPRAILRADYVFRLVDVPDGTSVVDFRYEPKSLRLGVTATMLTLVGAVAAVAASVRRRHAGARPGREARHVA